MVRENEPVSNPYAPPPPGRGSAAPDADAQAGSGTEARPAGGARPTGRDARTGDGDANGARGRQQPRYPRPGTTPGGPPRPGAAGGPAGSGGAGREGGGRNDAGRPGGAGGPVPGAVPVPPPDPELVARAGRTVRLFGVLLVASVLVSALPLPWRVAALVLAVGAAVAGVRALVAASRARLAGGLVPMLAVGVALTLLLATSTLQTVLPWSVQVEREDCLRGALTHSAQAGCEQDYQDSVQDWLTGLRDGAGSAG